MQVFYDRVTEARRVKPVSFLLASGGGERDVRTMNRQDSDITDTRTALFLDDIRHGRCLPASEDVMVDGSKRGDESKNSSRSFARKSR